MISIIAIVVLVLIGVFSARAILVRKYIRKLRRHLSQFTPIEDLDYYEESKPPFFVGSSKPFEHAVLLLHGYSGNTQEFESLTRSLREEQIPFFAPLLTGFGLNSFRLLYKIEYSDWLRDAEHAYTQMAALANKVTIIAQSTGSNLAMYLASKYQIDHLILVGPNFFPSAEDLKIKKLLHIPLLGRILLFLIPVFAKPVRQGRQYPSDTLDQEAAKRAFSYYTLPTRSLLIQWALQDSVDIRKIKCRELSIIYGEEDLTVDNQATLDYLKKERIPFKSQSFAKCAHNVFQDYNKEEVIHYVLKLLNPND